MPTVVSSILPFPFISWWANILQANPLLFDKAEHFEKMTARNRYAIAAANGKIQLSIPIEKGRNYRAPMRDIKIASEKWQVQHWRTLTSAYNRSPFFEHYTPSLQKLFETQFTYLIDFSQASIEYVQQQLKMRSSFDFVDSWQKVYDNTSDLRVLETCTDNNFPQYHQVFSDRIGFLPDLSILDLLFAEGPATLKWLEKNKDLLLV